MPNQIAFYPQSSGGGAGSMTLIQAQTATGTPAAITFSGIPQTFSHLKLIWAGSSVSNAGTFAAVQFNGLTSGYVAQAISCATGASTSTPGGFSQTSIIVGGSEGEATFPGYSQTIGSCHGTGYVDGANFVTGGGYSGTVGAVTSISLIWFNGTDWAAGGTFSLYGIQ
jgi:hypothetical protein